MTVVFVALTGKPDNVQECFSGRLGLWVPIKQVSKYPVAGHNAGRCPSLRFTSVIPPNPHDDDVQVNHPRRSFTHFPRPRVRVYHTGPIWYASAMLPSLGFESDWRHRPRTCNCTRIAQHPKGVAGRKVPLQERNLPLDVRERCCARGVQTRDWDIQKWVFMVRSHALRKPGQEVSYSIGLHAYRCGIQPRPRRVGRCEGSGQCVY